MANYREVQLCGTTRGQQWESCRPAYELEIMAPLSLPNNKPLSTFINMTEAKKRRATEKKTEDVHKWYTPVNPILH